MQNMILPPLDRALSALSGLLEKAENHIQTRNIKPEALLSFRLFPDMFDFTRQVQLTCDFSARAAARLAGVDVPAFPDTETNFAELRARVDRARAFVASVPQQGFAEAESRAITIKMRGQDVTMTGLEYWTLYSLPQIYFHLTTAYDILRHNGVELGKRDYMGVGA
ncbi:MAG: DUF1993 domain-containing protein [Paracoccaceae bacterium]